MIGSPKPTGPTVLPRPRPGGEGGRRGVAVVEFAIVAPIIVFLAVGMLEIARGLLVKEVLTDAARQACRTAILPTASNDAVKSDVRQVVTDNNIKGSDVTVKVYVNGVEKNCNQAKQRDKISVKVSVPVSKVCWITPYFFPATAVESETVTMMRQR